MRTFLWAVALTISITPASAADSFLNGTELLKYCEGGVTQKAVCEGYLQGVSDTLDYVGQTTPASKISASCVPVGTKPEVLRKIFIKMGHLGLHNEQPASSLAGLAFSAVWDCAQNAKFKDAIEILGKSLRQNLN